MSRVVDVRLTFDDADAAVIEALAESQGSDFDTYVAINVHKLFAALSKMTRARYPEICQAIIVTDSVARRNGLK
jgi:hypothetical protein